MSLTRKKQRVLASPASDIKYGANDFPGFCQLLELFLRAADVPRWRTFIKRIEVNHAKLVFHRNKIKVCFLPDCNLNYGMTSTLYVIEVQR